MPALVKSRFGESGMSDEDGTMVCSFDLKKSKNDWRICELVIKKNQPVGMRSTASQSHAGKFRDDVEVVPTEPRKIGKFNKMASGSFQS
jgi:hypothetical protein